MNTETQQFVESSGNVFADLGLDEADELYFKSQMAQVIRERIRERGLSQAAAAALLNTQQGKISLLMNGRVSGFTTDRLLRHLNELGLDVEIFVRRPRRVQPGRVGHTRFTVAAAEPASSGA